MDKTMYVTGRVSTTDHRPQTNTGTSSLSSFKTIKAQKYPSYFLVARLLFHRHTRPRRRRRVVRHTHAVHRRRLLIPRVAARRWLVMFIQKWWHNWLSIVADQRLRLRQLQQRVVGAILCWGEVVCAVRCARVDSSRAEVQFALRAARTWLLESQYHSYEGYYYMNVVRELLDARSARASCESARCCNWPSSRRRQPTAKDSCSAYPPPAAAAPLHPPGPVAHPAPAASAVRSQSPALPCRPSAAQSTNANRRPYCL